MTDQVDITPSTHFLASVRADRGSYAALLAEGVDNAFDAGATQIVLTLSKNDIVLRDNGIGITRDRELAIVRLGQHGQMPTTNLGMFGIGLKYQAMSAGDVLTVESVSADGRMKLSADWAQIDRLGSWSIDRPTWTSVIRGQTGTTIKISALRWSAPTAKDVKQSRDRLAEMFYPALAAGRQIVLNGETVDLLHEPEMTAVVEGDVRLASGKGAHVRGGLLMNPASPLYQVQLSYKHRVLTAKSLFGCGEFGGTRRMFARVDLIGPWTLARFKDKLADNDNDALEKEVLDILRPVLEQCHSAQMSIRVDEMAALLNAMLPPTMVPARPPRKKPEPGEPGERQRERKKPGKTNEGNETQSGPARRPKTHETLMIDFDEPLDSEVGCGHFVRGRPNRIILARDNPIVSELLGIRDQSIAARCLYVIASFLYQHDQEYEKKQGVLGFDGPIGLRVAQMVNLQKADEAVA